MEFGLGFGAFFGGVAAGHDGGAETCGEVFRKVVMLLAAVDVDGLAGGVDDDFAVMAASEVFFDFGEQLGVDLTVEVVGEFSEKIRAVHFEPSLAALRK